MRQHKGKVARHSGRERGPRGGFRKAGSIRSATKQQVAQTLHHHAAAGEHVAELRDVVAVFDRLVKGLREMCAHEHRKVRVLRAQVCVMVAVAVYDGDAAFVMLFTHDAAGVHAERAHLVFERVRIVDELRLIKVLRQVIHDGVGHLHAHADVHLVVGERDAEALAFILQPLGAAAAGRHDDVRAVNIPSVLAGDIVHANCAAVFHDHVFRRGGAHEREILMLHEPFVHVLEHDGGIFRAHVAHGAAHQVDVVAACLIGDLRNLWVALAVHGIRRAETDVNGIRIVDERLCFRF